MLAVGTAFHGGEEGGDECRKGASGKIIILGVWLGEKKSEDEVLE